MGNPAKVCVCVYMCVHLIGLYVGKAHGERYNKSRSWKVDTSREQKVALLVCQVTFPL